MSKISVVRVYDDPKPHSGYRALVDRLWPRGIKKVDLEFDEWCKEVAPSNELRKWYGHEVEKYDEFRTKYRAELDDSGEAKGLLERAGRKNLTLLISAHDEQHSQGTVLQEYLEELRAK